MGANARGFLLFSFAFSSVLSSPEIAVPSNDIQMSTVEVEELVNNNTNVNVAINRCVLEGSCSGGIEKRELSYLTNKEEGGRGKFENLIRLEEKRARVGFTGMRGKKESYFQGNGLNEFLDMLEKRTRMGFNGMRGKRYEKRTSMAFQGMRGKKSEEYDDDSDDRMMDYVMDEYQPGEKGWEKRTMAFHGMRGRRSSFDGVNLSKRYPYSDGIYDLKRTMGFLGMRGKKASESWNLGDYKRGVQSGFFGMKGKKAQSGFFGMRGKKAIPGFDGFQVDALNNEFNTIKSSPDESVSRQERVRRGTNWLRNSKKAKNAFFAVRGKKSSGSDLNLISGN